MYIDSITIDSYRRAYAEKCVEYSLRVSGLTKYLHPMCFYDPDCCLTRDLALFTHWTRFSRICQLHKALKREFPTVELPEFPRHWLPIRSQSAIQRRMGHLNAYFSLLLENEHVRHSQTFLTFFQPRHTLHLKIVGVPGVGKMRLLEGFLRATNRRMSEQIPRLGKDQLEASTVYPDRCDIPIDMIVDQALIRISRIAVSQIDSEDVDEADGVIFAYSEAKPGSLKPVQEKRRQSRVESAVVALDEGELICQGQFSAGSCADAYMVFEYVVRRHIKNSRN